MSVTLPPWAYIIGAVFIAGVAYYIGGQSDHVTPLPPAAARAATPERHLRVVEEIRISDHETLRLIEIPDPYVPYHCVALTDSAAPKTTMFCPEMTPSSSP